MKDIRRLAPREVWRSLQEQPTSLLIDVRDPVEFAFVGHPLGAVNVPWKMAPHWQIDPNFVDRVKALAPEPDRPIYLLCRSGQRSLDAATTLAAAGYSNVTNVEEGFEGPIDSEKHRGTAGGWRFHGLPWEQT